MNARAYASALLLMATPVTIPECSGCCPCATVDEAEHSLDGGGGGHDAAPDAGDAVDASDDAAEDAHEDASFDASDASDAPT